MVVFNIFNRDGIITDYGTYILDEFEFEYGRVLENLPVEYFVCGNPKYDDEGNIINAIVYSHGFKENCNKINEYEELTKPGAVFDKNDYFIISITSLGFPSSACPSVSGLKYQFPKYSILDRVNFKRQFLKEKFGLEKVHGIAGRGLGGYDVYTWACEYPDEMDFIIVSNSAFKTNGYRYIVSKAVDSIIDTSDDFYDDTYSESLSRIMVSLNKIAYSNFFSKKVFQELSNDEIDVLMDDFVDEGLFMDIYDFKYRNDVMLSYDLEDKLKNIKAKTLVISESEDVYYSPNYDALPIENLIDNSKVILSKSKNSFDEPNDLSSIIEELWEFMDEFKK